MIRKCKIVLQIAMMILVVTSATAEEAYDYDRFGYRTELFGTIGTGTWTSNDSGLVAGGGVIFRPYPKAGFELQIRRFNSTQEDTSPDYYSLTEDRGTIFIGTVHYYFNELRFQPYLLLGGGYGRRHSVSLFRSAELGEHRNDFDESSLLMEAGGGVNIFVTDRISVRPDVRLTIGGFGSVQASANVCYHW